MTEEFSDDVSLYQELEHLKTVIDGLNQLLFDAQDEINHLKDENRQLYLEVQDAARDSYHEGVSRGRNECCEEHY